MLAELALFGPITSSQTRTAPSFQNERSWCVTKVTAFVFVTWSIDSSWHVPQPSLLDVQLRLLAVRHRAAPDVAGDELLRAEVGAAARRVHHCLNDLGCPM